MTAIAERFDIVQERARLGGMHMEDLRRLARTACGYESRTRNRQYLVRRILWSLQAAAHGGLSERATALAQTLLQDLAHGDVRARPRRAVAPEVATQTPTPAAPAAATPTRDERLPRPGHAIVRRYKGETLRVMVLSKGFEFRGDRYDSLSAIAKAVTGSHINGFRFFKLLKVAA